MKQITALVIAALMSGCAFTPHAVVITPTAEVSPTRIGASRSIALTVVDERPRQTLGTRGAAGIGADMTIAGDIRAIVEKALTEGLTKNNFLLYHNLGGNNKNSKELKVEIRNLDYRVIVGLFIGTLTVDAGLKAICVDGGQRLYEQFHRGEVSDNVFLVQFAAANDAYVSQAISSAIKNVLSDRALLDCLAA